MLYALWIGSEIQSMNKSAGPGSVGLVNLGYIGKINTFYRYCRGENSGLDFVMICDKVTIQDIVCFLAA